MDEWRYNVGDRVRSKQIGIRGEFIGVVHDRFVTGGGVRTYHVLDDEGALWHRNSAELSEA